MRKMLLIILCLASFLLLSCFSVSALPITGTFTPVNNSGSVTISVPYPSNESWIEINDSSMNITVSNNLAEEMNVSFYWGSNDSLIGTDTGVSNNSVASVIVGFDYIRYQQYWWYVTVNSSSYDQRSDDWWFKGEAYDYDINRDNQTNYQDTGAVALVYGSDPFDGREDVNGDNKVNYLDTGEVALHYGE